MYYRISCCEDRDTRTEFNWTNSNIDWTVSFALKQISSRRITLHGRSPMHIDSPGRPSAYKDALASSSFHTSRRFLQSFSQIVWNLKVQGIEDLWWAQRLGDPALTGLLLIVWCSEVFCQKQTWAFWIEWCSTSRTSVDKNTQSWVLGRNKLDLLHWYPNPRPCGFWGC